MEYTAILKKLEMERISKLNDLPIEFFKLLDRAIQYSPKERRTNELLNFCDYSDKQIHLYKSEDTSD
jgi:hypothetical protein